MCDSSGQLVRRCAAVSFLLIAVAVVVGGAKGFLDVRPALASSLRPHSHRADSLFDFRSNMWVNLHHFLYQTARARRGMDRDRVATQIALTDTIGFGALNDEQRGAWNRAVAYYEQSIAARDILFDSSLVRTTNTLSDLSATRLARDAGIDSALANALDAAAPVYRALWWPRHDAQNRKWIVTVRLLLAEHGDSAARWEARIFQQPWAAAPVRVDVAMYTTWAGAYTTENPSRINVASAPALNEGVAAFETLFHEVLHTMDGPLETALRTGARANNKHTRRDPTHVFIFYTAGELTRSFYPRYTPMADSLGIWARTNGLDGMLPLVKRFWQPWIEGRSSFDEAVRAIANDM